MHNIPDMTDAPHTNDTLNITTNTNMLNMPDLSQGEAEMASGSHSLYQRIFTMTSGTQVVALTEADFDEDR